MIFWISLVLMSGILLVTLSGLQRTTGIVSVFISHILLTSISKSLYLDNFSVNFAKVLLSDETAMSMNMHLLSFLSLTTMPGLLAFISLSVSTGISQSIVTSLFSVTVVGWCSCHSCSVVSIS